MSEVLRLPSGWSESNLNEVARAIGGGTPSKANPEYWTGGTIPWVSPKDMKSFLLSSSEDRITSIALDRLTLIPKNSVLVVVRSGILSRTLPVALNDMPVTINQDMRAFVPEGGIDARFVAWQMVAMEREILSSCSKDGTTVASIEGQALARFPLNIAPAAEQTRIVAKLEELLSDLDSGVAELKAAQKKLQHYRQSLLKAAVGGALTASWREAQRTANTPLESGAQLLGRILRERRARWEEKQLAKFKEQGKTPPKDWQKKYVEPVAPDTTCMPALPEGWVWASVDQLSPDDLANGRSVPTADAGGKVLRLTAIKDGSVDLQEYKLGSWSEEDAKPFAVTEGDLLIVRGNGSLHLVGRAGLVGSVEEQVAYPDTMIRLRVVESVVNPAWIGLVWDSHIVRTHLERRARTSAGIYKIAQPDIVSAVVPIPSLLEQAQIREAFELQLAQIVATQTALETSFKQSMAQRQNILRAASGGRIVPQDPNDEPASVLLERIRSERVAQAATKKPRRRKIKGATA